MTSKPILTRFAPSPTGSLHVGGARTALFCWAYARRYGGQFLLRIEDTDQARSTEASTAGILRDLKWLGLDWDQGPELDAAGHVTEKGDRGPYFQSKRLDLYQQHLDRLLSEGKAYKCFKTTEQLDAERQAARKEKRAYKYDSTEALSLTAEQIAAYEAEGRPYVIRFRMPGEDLVVNDLVLGEVRFPIEQQDDFVIRKADGYPTFHLAVVVDDHEMQVSHVIRGQEHLNNTAKHVALQDALGFDRPNYAHIPLIFNADGSKMSKRDKAKVARAEAKAQGLPSLGVIDDDRFQAFMNKKNDDIDIAAAIAEKLGLTLPEIDVDDFRRSGYLPEVLNNYLALLGWSPGDNVERFGDDPLGFIREKFSLERVGKSNARFDREKLFRFNAEAIVTMDPRAFRQQVYAVNDVLHEHFEGPDDPKFAMFCNAYQERSRTLVEPMENAMFFFVANDAVAYDEKAVQKVLHKNDGDGLKVLEELKAKFEQIPHEGWSAEPLHELVKQHAEETGRGMGKVAQPIRVAVSGNTISPPIDQTLVILGKDAVLRRIERCVRECAAKA
ncbi:glutamate--tRNA ligase [Phycisphaerales bacterium AB-hyl4]|uniref:Glutamate--tRNA ligase n=1 Tax=Natronomicrosphaera hydrolytica TaxID=3242702 RepID=A0ABV4U861_9BACT